MINNIQLSIIISVNKKDENLLSECLSIIEQEAIPKNILEIIVVSSYSVNSIINKYKKIDIKTLCLQNVLNLNTLKNSGLDAANGKYITFMDVNQRIIPTKLIDIISFINKNSFYNIFCCNHIKLIDTKTNLCSGSNFNFSGKIFKTKFLKENQIYFCDQGVDSLYILSKLSTKKIYFLDKVFNYSIIQKEKGQINKEYFDINIYNFNEYLQSIRKIYDECIQRNIQLSTISEIFFEYWYYLYEIINIIIYHYGINNISDYLKQIEQYYLDIYKQIENYITRKIMAEKINTFLTQQPLEELIFPNVSYPEFKYRIENKDFILSQNDFNYFYE